MGAILGAPMGTRKSLAISIATGLLLAPLTAQSAEKICDPEDPESCVQAVMAGEVVPYSGYLLTYRRSARVVANTERCADLRAMDLEEAHQLHQLQLDVFEKKLQNNKEMHQLEIDLMRQQAEAILPQWYEHPAIMIGMTVILTTGIFFAAVKTVEALK